MNTPLRADLATLEPWIKPGSRVLDLGCGDGSLLAYLKHHKQVQGYGLEIDPGNIEQCVTAGVNVIEQNLDEGLQNFIEHSFDVVIMTQALQTVHFPNLVLEEMLRIGRECIITFPNFGHWRCRSFLSLHGRMPVSESLPFTWYNTPNIHLCTFKDFEALCTEKNIQILNRQVVDHSYRSSRLMNWLPNLLGEVAIYRVTR